MRYVESRVRKEQLDKAYRIYVTDSLKFISENTAKYAGGNSYSKRYIDLTTKQPEETRTREEIIGSIRDKLQKMEE